MDITCIQPPDMAPAGGHYSPAVVGGGMAWVAGQLPIDASGRKLGDQPFEVQARQVLANVEAALRAAGTSPDRLLQVRVYLVNIDDWPAFNTLYAQWLGPHRPARAVVPVPALHFGLQLEVEAVALMPAPRSQP